MRKQKTFSFKMILFLKRGIKSTFKLLQRNFWIFFLNVFVFSLALFLFSFFLLFEKTSCVLISKIEEKADVSVYFKEEVPEEEILKLKEELSKKEGIEKVTFISKEEALAEFSKRHKENPVLMEALKEVGNPFLASLSVKVKDPNYFQKILKFLEEKDEILEKVDYFQRKPIIEKIFSFTKTLKKGLLVSFFFFFFFSCAIIFVTTQLSLLAFKEEIEIQKLVGASDLIISLPFLIQIVFVIFLSSFISLFLLGVISFFVSPKIEILFPELNLFAIFKDHFIFFFISSVVLATFFGLFSSFFAIKRYLKI